LNLSDDELTTDTTRQQAPTHKEVSSAPVSNAEFPREWIIKFIPNTYAYISILLYFYQ